jgi:uncharacterized protein (TIGR03435 family)
MLRALLAERFKLATHHEQRQIPFLVLTVGKHGPKMREAKEGTNSPRQPQIPGRIISNRMSMPTLATLLSRFMRQTVLDRTAFTGSYEINLTWTPENFRSVQAPTEQPDASLGPSIFTAVQEQLGLKLQSHKGPIDVLVIDHAEKTPIGNRSIYLLTALRLS